MSMETTTLKVNAPQLMALSQIGMSTPSAQAELRQPESKPAVFGSDQLVTLRPRPLLWLRKSLMCGWCGYLLTTPWTPTFKLDCCLIGLVILGTFRTTLVSAFQIEWHYRFGFLPFYQRHLRVSDQVCILTGWEEQSGLGEALLLGLWAMCFAPLSDWLCPWPGGPYRLWVKNSQGHRVLVWRGRVEKTFYRNHKLLSQSTGLPSQRVPVT